MSEKKDETTFKASDTIMTPVELNDKTVVKEAAKDAAASFLIPSIFIGVGFSIASLLGYLTGANRATKECNKKIMEHNIDITEKYLKSDEETAE